MKFRVSTIDTFHKDTNDEVVCVPTVAVTSGGRIVARYVADNGWRWKFPVQLQKEDFKALGEFIGRMDIDKFAWARIWNKALYRKMKS